LVPLSSAHVAKYWVTLFGGKSASFRVSSCARAIFIALLTGISMLCCRQNIQFKSIKTGALPLLKWLKLYVPSSNPEMAAQLAHQ
jgi:hypothetical protein